MKARDADILILPGLFGGAPEIWYRRWESRLTTARIVEQERWDDPDRGIWVETVVRTVAGTTRPVVLVGHSLGAITIVHAAPEIAHLDVRAAFLVAPPDLEAHSLDRPRGNSFLPVPEDPLPFPSFVIASRSDPWCTFQRADEMAAAWGSLFLDAGESGHINAESGHGPWPEGLMVFARMMSRI